MNRIFYLLIIISFGCSVNSEKEKYQNERKNVVKVQDTVKEIDVEELILSNSCALYIMGEYLIIEDFAAYDKHLHVFNKKSFDYITSFVDKGQGPNEITNIGHIGIDEINRILFVSDHGKQCIFSYSLDSVLLDPFFIPTIKMRMNER